MCGGGGGSPGLVLSLSVFLQACAVSKGVCEFPAAPESRTVSPRPGFGAASWVAALLTT